MPAAPLPPDEDERLRTLARYEVLDDAPDAALDRLTTLAARLFRVPIALVSVIGQDRQVFRSHHGIDICGTSRDLSFCAHAILSGDKPLIVFDAMLDPRFADNPLVTGAPGIRFYAGVPLRVADGQALGTFCIVDTTPRFFSSEERATLLDLAATAVDTLELHRSRRLAHEEAAERHWMENALRQSEKRLRRMAANTPGMIYQFVRNPDGTFYFPFVGDGCREFFGVEAQAIYDRPELVLDVLDAEARIEFQNSLTLSAATLEPWRLCVTYRAPDGSTRWAEGASRAEKLADGRVLWNGMLMDVTDRKRAEQEAERAARRVRTVLESIGDAFYSLDREWRFTYVNDQALRQLERRREDLIGRVFWEALPHKAEMDYFPPFHRAVETGAPEGFEIYSPTLEKWFDVHAYPSEEGLSVYSQEITERVRAQREMEDSHQLISAIIDGITDAVFIKDLEGCYLLINPSGAALLGRTPEEIAGKDDFAFFPAESARQIRDFDREVIRTDECRTYESTDVIDGVEHVFLSTKSPYRDAAGKLLGVIGIAREITEQRRAAEALREAKEEAETANHAKSEFLSRMSHELRTPLNAILGFGQLLEISDLGQRPTESIGHILKAGRHLLGLIDEVLAISRIEAGRMDLSLEPVSLGDVVAECLSLVSRLAQDRGVHCENRLPSDDSARRMYVLADRQRLRQVLLNVLSNAVKYNREGGTITLTCIDLPAVNGGASRRLRLEVADTGIGMTAEQIGRLFTPFERLGAERTAVEGTGLGLALSKGLVEAMDGRIGAGSVPGVGSTFWVEFPLARDPLEGLDVDGQSLSGFAMNADDYAGTVLYVEDNLSNLRLIEMLLDSQPGLQLLSAQQGMLGLEIARARHPDLILLDLHLPDVPGWEVLAALQLDPVTCGIPVVVISADATAGQIERLKAAGARDYLTKPIDVPALLGVLRQYLNGDYSWEERELAVSV